MVKGITRQVIVVQSPDRDIFEQAIFIVKEDAPDVTDEMLLKEAEKAIRGPKRESRRSLRFYGPAWACGGAILTGLLWLVTGLL